MLIEWLFILHYMSVHPGSVISNCLMKYFNNICFLSVSMNHELTSVDLSVEESLCLASAESPSSCGSRLAGGPGGPWGPRSPSGPLSPCGPGSPRGPGGPAYEIKEK